MAVGNVTDDTKREDERVQSAPILIALNLVAGAILWFFAFTDFSWTGTIGDYVYPLIALGLAIGSVVLAGLRWRLNASLLLACLPSLVGGGLALLLVLSMVVVPLGGLFFLGELKHETLIQRAESPDHLREARVFFRPVGAYAGGNGRILVSLNYRWLPFIERDVYARDASHASEQTREYLRWKDPNTLVIVGEPGEKQRQVTIGLMRFEMPLFLLVPIRLIRLLRE